MGENVNNLSIEYLHVNFRYFSHTISLEKMSNYLTVPTVNKFLVYAAIFINNI